MMILSGLAALWGACSLSTQPRKAIRISLALIHGFGMTLALTSGIALYHQLPTSQEGTLPTWLWAKAAVWLLLGASMVLAKRKAHWGPGVLGIFLGLAITASALAYTHS